MSSNQDQVRALAERIARRVTESAEQKAADPAGAMQLNDELAAMRQSLNELQQRLSHIESHLSPEDAAAQDRTHADGGQQTTVAKPASQSAPVTRSPWLSGMYVPATHPSQEKFGVEEAAVSELVDFFEGAKTCELEPGGKPCDHCAMCSSRGF
jgi:TolA-binding protein